MTEITLQNIGKKYGDFTALENLNCTIKSGCPVGTVRMWKNNHFADDCGTRTSNHRGSI